MRDANLTNILLSILVRKQYGGPQENILGKVTLLFRESVSWSAKRGVGPNSLRLFLQLCVCTESRAAVLVTLEPKVQQPLQKHCVIQLTGVGL